MTVDELCDEFKLKGIDAVRSGVDELTAYIDEHKMTEQLKFRLKDFGLSESQMNFDKMTVSTLIRIVSANGFIIMGPNDTK